MYGFSLISPKRKASLTYELDEKYPTEEVTAPAQPQVEDDVKIAVPSEMKAEPIAETEEVSAHPKRQSKFSHLKFGDNYDVTAD